MRTVCGHDIHKDSIFMCILDDQGKKIEEKFGVSTREISRLPGALKKNYVNKETKNIFRSEQSIPTSCLYIRTNQISKYESTSFGEYPQK